MLLARIHLNSRVQTNTLRIDLIPLLLVLPSEPLTTAKYSPSSTAGMASLQENVSSPWAARVCSADQPTHTERRSPTKCEQPLWKGFISGRTAPYRHAHLPACTPAQRGGSCLESGDYGLSHVRGSGRAARLDTKSLASVAPEGHLINISVSCKQGGAHVRERCSSDGSREDGTSEIHSKMKQLCGQNHTVTGFVLHKAGWARSRQQKTPDCSLVSADLGWAQSRMKDTEMELKRQMRSSDSSSRPFVGPGDRCDMMNAPLPPFYLHSRLLLQHPFRRSLLAARRQGVHSG